MGRFVLRQLYRHFTWPATALTVSALVTLISFQNCGKAGFVQSSSESELVVTSSEMKKFSAAPFPFDANINQLAYMSCPMAGKSQGAGEDVDNPFFTFRGGAYDNRNLAARFPLAFGTRASTAEEKADRLNAGVGLSKNFVDYMEREFASRLSVSDRDEKSLLYRNAILSSQFKAQLSSAVVYQQRAQDFAISKDDAKPILPPLADIAMANQLVTAPEVTGSSLRERVHMANQADAGTLRSFVSSIGIAEDESQRDQLRDRLGALQFVIGYTEPDLQGDVLSLLSPTQNSSKTLYGKAYRFSTTATWPGRVDRTSKGSGFELSTVMSRRTPSPFVNGVSEVETESGQYKATKGQEWDCFSLLVVRDIDRRFVDGRLIDPGEIEDKSQDCTLWTDNCTKKVKFVDFQARPDSPVIRGVKAACPPQRLGGSASFGGLNSAADGGKNRMRLEIARRFLPAELWEINTDPEYMCAVPLERARSYGSCYQSGDNNAGRYIVYDEYNQNPAPCGPNQNECSAHISICYRKN